MFFRRKPKAAPVAQPAPVVSAYGEPDMVGIGRVLWQRKTRIFGFTLLAAAASFLVVNSITPRYRSETRLLLEARENAFMRAEADKNNFDRNTVDPEAVTSQIQVVLSRDLAREVVRKEKLTEKPEFDSSSIVKTILGLVGMGRDPGSLSPEERTLEAFYERLNAYAVEKSRVIAIDFSSADPELAARIANSIATTYLSMQQSAKADQTRAASDWLANEISNMRQRVAEAEAKVEEYRFNKNLFVGTNNTSLPGQQLTEINSQISAARGQADRFIRHRQFRIDAPPDRPAHRAALAAGRAVDHAARATPAHQGIAFADRRDRGADPRRRRASGAST
jgi:uncharacterized protein involved in exopolysaccharide biosynthesis